MLDEIIKELTATRNDDHITSGGVLAWAKRVEVQRSQAAVLNTLSQDNLTELCYAELELTSIGLKASISKQPVRGQETR